MNNKNIIKTTIEQYLADNPFMGQIAIAKKDQIIYKSAIGYRDFESNESFADDQVFIVASITKQFTAATILKYVEKGLLDLFKPLSTYLPSDHYVWEEDMPDWANKVNLHQMLCHISGLPDYYFTALAYPADWEFVLALNDDKEIYTGIVRAIKTHKLQFEPGSQFMYNNFNSLLLGLILTDLAPNNDISKLFKDMFFDPLCMKNTFFPNLNQEMTYIRNIYADDTYPKRYLVEYKTTDADPVRINDHGINVPLGAGGALFSTTDDLLKWNYALHTGKVISLESLELMKNVYVRCEGNPYLDRVAYGYCLYVEDIDNSGRNIYSHPGMIAGISTFLSYDPVNDIGIAVLSNCAINVNNPEKSVKFPGRVLFSLIENLHLALRS